MSRIIKLAGIITGIALAGVFVVTPAGALEGSLGDSSAMMEKSNPANVKIGDIEDDASRWYKMGVARANFEKRKNKDKKKSLLKANNALCEPVGLVAGDDCLDYKKGYDSVK
ncbi:hypothetical protein [Streptomyces aureoversilis]|uniref:Secreted protein n=1 Tax=Streptomyces aureoversilis TaxID=67277 RepID=A0ABW0A8F0_9ACTN